MATAQNSQPKAGSHCARSLAAQHWDRHRDGKEVPGPSLETAAALNCIGQDGKQDDGGHGQEKNRLFAPLGEYGYQHHQHR